jgi:DnaJ-class molecular chaperone
VKVSDLKTYAVALREIAADMNHAPGVRTRLFVLADSMEVSHGNGGSPAARKPECPNCRGDSEVFAPEQCPTCFGTGVEEESGEIEWLTQPEDQALEAMLKDVLNGVDMAMGVRAGELLRFYEPAEACARARAEFMHDRERVVKAIVDIRMRQTPRFEVRQ